jgi:hypothetical protein
MIEISKEERCGCGYHALCYWHCDLKGRDPKEVEKERLDEKHHRELLKALKGEGK